MTPEIFKQILESGENSLIEFKNENFHSDSLAKEIVALSNLDGGDIINGEKLHFEAMRIAGTAIKDIDLLRFRDYCTNYRKINFENGEIENLLYNLQIITEDKEMTIMGMLFSGMMLIVIYLNPE
ncbi:MAG: hypothetical protein HY738_00045 [Bacteroidia bacterium]|nr:hypothetical protein [Bacteroidia bacterium]